MLDKKLSVIIPVYNVEKFLSATINSVVSQTYKNTEIILVNDGSTDKSLEICRKFEKTDSRIKVVDKQNEGVSSARNAGINASTGEYIAFVDSDDIVLPNIYESMILKIEKTNAQIAICNIYDVLILKNGSEEVGLIDHNMSDNTVFEKEQIYNKMILPWMGIGEKTQITNCINSVFNKVYKTELIKGNNILYREDLRVGEDSEFVIRTLLNAESLVFDSNIGYKYMRHNQDSLTHKCMKDLFYIKCKRYEIFKELVPEYCS
ncbi:MAG: glycosyltransferase, partial [Clostridia bacterium]|nr:glycosyltransferase [Clostridia bacterium]